MSVLVMGNIEVYERDGVYQIIATEIAPLGGALCTFSSNRPRKSLKKWAYLM